MNMFDCALSDEQVFDLITLTASSKRNEDAVFVKETSSNQTVKVSFKASR